jgi:ParB/RepB/Spo0J family partition protein
LSDIEKSTNTKTVIYLPADIIHSSKILPKRNHGEKIKQSVKQLGIIQPIIVRLIQSSNGEFEVIDGEGRLESLQPGELVPVIIIDASDSEVFKLSNATFQRKNRSVLEIAEFYYKWLQTIKKETQTIEGDQATLAKRANHSEGLISQYLSIYQFFKKLETLSNNSDFSALKCWDLNRLYQLSKILESPQLLEISQQLEAKPECSLQDLKDLVEHTLLDQPQSMELADEHRKLEEASKLIDTDDDNPSQTAEAKIICKKLKPKKLANLIGTAKQNLNEVTPKLTNAIQEIETDTERYSSIELLSTVKHVIKLLKRLQSYTETLTQTASSNQNTETRTPPNLDFRP